MGNILYLDCFSGVSGDMLLGTLLDLGASLEEIEDDLKQLDIPDFSLEKTKVKQKSITGTDVRVNIPEEHDHRHLKDILNLLDNTSFSKTVKDNIRLIFENLARAEAKIHGKSIDEVHFHEVGALDSIIDIFGCVLGLEKLNITQIHASPLHVGEGFVNCEHGKMPVPAPATLELIANRQTPVYSQGIKTELCTPTGAGIVTTLAKDFGPIPGMTVTHTGFGSGKKRLEDQANFLRGVLGTNSQTSTSPGPNSSQENCHQTEVDRVYLLEANIDDMNPELYSDVMEKSFDKGALDVYLCPIQMKNQRPANLLKVISPPDKIEELRYLLLRHTTTLGVRGYMMDRLKLSKEVRQVDTPLGTAEVKIGKLGSELFNWSPEYKRAKELSQTSGVPLKEVYQIITKNFLTESDESE